MAISVRLNKDQENEYRRYAKEHNMTISQFFRKSADDAIAKEQEEKEHELFVKEFKTSFEEFMKLQEQYPPSDITDEEIEKLRLEQYDLA